MEVNQYPKETIEQYLPENVYRYGDIKSGSHSQIFESTISEFVWVRTMNPFLKLLSIVQPNVDFLPKVSKPVYQETNEVVQWFFMERLFPISPKQAEQLHLVKNGISGLSTTPELISKINSMASELLPQFTILLNLANQLDCDFYFDVKWPNFMQTIEENIIFNDVIFVPTTYSITDYSYTNLIKL